MLEQMLLLKKKGSGWNGQIPSADANTLFRLANFTSLSQVKDSGPNSIPVTINGSVSVGSDSLGNFVNFPGSGAFLSFTSSFLNGSNLDIKIIMSYPVFPGGIYGASILDGRPNQTNGNYLSVFYPNVAPFKIIPYYNATEGPNSSSIDQKEFPCVIDLKVRPGYIETSANGKVIGRWENSFTFVNNAPFKIARHAYSNAVPDAVFKMYYFEMKKVT